MDPLTMMLIGSGIGLAKSKFIDGPKEEKDRELAARTQELSPWTGLKANTVKAADPFGSALKYGATGLEMGRQANYDKAMMGALDRGDYGQILKADSGWSGVKTKGTPVFGLKTVSPYSDEELMAYGG